MQYVHSNIEVFCMLKYLFKTTRIPWVILILVLIMSGGIIWFIGEYINITDGFKTSYLTVLSILFGFIFSIIIFINEQLGQITRNIILDDAQKNSIHRYIRFYGYLTNRLLCILLLALILLIVLLVSYIPLDSFLNVKELSIIKLFGKFILFCCSLYFWILTGIIFKGIFSFITHRKSETAEWLDSVKFNDSHRSINE